MLQVAVLGDYIGKVCLPTVNAMNLFDERFTSKAISLSNPDFVHGLIITIFTISLLIAAIRKSLKLITFGISWFFVFHLLESTILPLEIYDRCYRFS
jgi:hypothetical protein